MFEEERPITIAVHSSLVEELKERQKIMLEETGRKSRGGITVFSRLAAMELKMMREEGERLSREVLKNKEKLQVYLFEGKEYVPYELYKNLYICASALSKKKDQKQIKLEVTKIKGCKKNEINAFW